MVCQMAVVFLQRRPKKGWFAVTEVRPSLSPWKYCASADDWQELVPWEEHLIRLSFSRGARRDDSASLTVALMGILTFCHERKDNVPPLMGSSEQSNLSHQVCHYSVSCLPAESCCGISLMTRRTDIRGSTTA